MKRLSNNKGGMVVAVMVVYPIADKDHCTVFPAPIMYALIPASSMFALKCYVFASEKIKNTL